MRETIKASGQCLCGEVTLMADKAKLEMGACHCGMCRKWSGGPLLAADCQTEVQISGLENVQVYASSDWAERGFCVKCGTHLFYRLKAAQQYFIPLGFFDGEIDWQFDHQMYIDNKPSFYCFSNETKNLTAEEVIALYGGDL